jgi:SAM-dependent methyltransferase
VIPFPLRSPATGGPLKADTRHSLAGAAGERWPVIDGIAYLRTGRDDLVREVLGHLDAGRRDEALVLLLAEQDDWWTGPPADPDQVAELVENRESLSLRRAVDLLGWARVGDYFVHRWSDPTYLAGLALLEAHWNRPRCVFELACGIGHYLRELQIRGFEVSGGDVVFAKLWVARHWILERPAQLVCFDAAAGWPIEGAPVDLVMCQDAFYFLEPKPEILQCMRKTAGEEGWLVVGHIHNADRPGHSAGSPVSAEEIEELFPDGLVYDDAELTRSVVEGRAPVPRPPHELRDVEAFSVVFGPGMRPAPRACRDGLLLPPAGAGLVRNPLYVEEPGGGARIAWPSARYADEYAPRATYPQTTDAPERAPMGPEVEAAARRRELVHLPERW